MKIMVKLVILGLMCVMGGTVSHGAADAEKVAVRAVLDSLFDAMREGDGVKLGSHILPGAQLDRIMPGKAIKHGTPADWVNSVNTLKPGQADEQIFDVSIHVEGPLATAWTPFTLTIDGELKSCGVNHFTLVKVEGRWKISYLIDTHTPEKCPTQEKD